jgi:hypothetical protein
LPQLDICNCQGTAFDKAWIRMKGYVRGAQHRLKSGAGGSWGIRFSNLLFDTAMQAAKEAELAAVRARIEASLGSGVSGKRLADLMSLAQFQMLSRDARAFRSPTVVLSMRPQRSVTMRCAALPLLFPFISPTSVKAVSEHGMAWVWVKQMLYTALQQ